MPRKGRVKDSTAVYHVMCHSVPEFLLFRDEEDKDYFLGLLKRYTETYKCSVYAYCLMDNHLHLHLDPKGFDISKFMHSLNTAYVRYYNKKYKRKGHVFQERFESKILDTDKYNFAVSAYIHNNPKDIEGFGGKEETYIYSSYGIYLGIHKDIHELIDKSFMMDLFNLSNEEVFVKRYREFVSHQRDIGSLGELKKKLSHVAENEYVSGRRIVLRELPPAKALAFVSSKMMVEAKSSLGVKARKELLQYRAFTSYVLRVLCGLTFREICNTMSNITISGCSKLCSKGYDVLIRDVAYREVFNELISCKI